MRSNDPEKDDLVGGKNSGFVVIRRSKTNMTFLSLAAFLFALSLVLAQLFAHSEIGSLRNTAKENNKNRVEEQAGEDCLNLYENDLDLALAKALIANNNLWVAVAGRAAGLTEEEEAAQNQRLGAVLDESNDPLRVAIDALEDYQRIKPPPLLCPHPLAVERRGGDD